MMGMEASADTSFDQELARLCVAGELSGVLGLATQLIQRGQEALGEKKPQEEDGRQRIDRLRRELETQCQHKLQAAKGALLNRPMPRRSQASQASFLDEALFAVEGLLNLAWLRAFGKDWDYIGPIKPAGPDQEVVSTYQLRYAEMRRDTATPAPESVLALFEYGHSIRPELRPAGLQERSRPAAPMLPALEMAEAPPSRRRMGWLPLALLSVFCAVAAFLFENAFLSWHALPQSQKALGSLYPTPKSK